MSRGPYDYVVEIDEPPNDTPCECGGCDWRGPYSQLEEIESASLTPGHPSPAGRCPECEALAYPAPAKPAEWSGSQDPDDPANFWIDDVTGERVNAATGERTPARKTPALNDHDLLLAIQELLDGTIWEADTVQRIAELLHGNGYVVRDREG